MNNDNVYLNITKFFSRKTYLALIASAMTIFCVNTSFADDTEVFFSQADRDSDIQPNVLFVLDTSGSMKNFDGTGQSRLDRMKDAMTTVINQSTGINVGVMRFNGTDGGGSVLYPVTSLEEQVCQSDDCGDISTISTITLASDDAEQRGDGTSMPGGNTLSLQQERDPNRAIGLRYSSLNVPQGATITSATISFVSNGNNDAKDSDTITIRVEDTSNAETFIDEKFNLTSRPYNIATDWNPGDWKTGGDYATSDISNLVQHVVNRGDWCGGNPISFAITGAAERDIKAYDAEPSDAPILNVTYNSDDVPAGGGCIVRNSVSTINASTDDSEERNGNPNPTSNDVELFYDSGDPQIIGLRFTNVNVPKNATIIDSYIEFTMRRDSWGNTSGIIYGEAKDSPSAFGNGKNDISNRNKTGQSIFWGGNDLPDRDAGEKLVTPQLNTLVRELTQRNNWSAGNTMAFLMDHTGDKGKHSAHSFDGFSAGAPKLIIKYESRVQSSDQGPTFVTARDRLLSEISSMNYAGGTPLVEAYYEAAQYMLGKDVVYGKERGMTTKHRFHRVSHPLSYVGGSVIRDEDCSDGNLDSSDCVSEKIIGSARYISPIEASCQANNIVLLTDGRPTEHKADERIESLIGQDCDNSLDTDERCGPELAKWLLETDTNGNNQSINTYTIGFNNKDDFLETLASNGDGDYLQASSSSELVARFQDILANVHSTDTSFVAPGATVNQFNRLTHRNDIYFALFRPDERPTWSGNLKRYEVALDSKGDVIIVDNSSPTQQNAINAEEGFFADFAKSFWSSSVDGSDVAKGGAAERLSQKSEDGKDLKGRRLFTILGDLNDVDAPEYDFVKNGDLIHESNADITDAHLGLASNEGSVDGVPIDRGNILKWLRGIDVKDEDADDNVSEFRQHIGDPMHSRPVIVNYENSSNPSQPYTTVFMGTNEGVLHGINNVDGDEIFSFIPPSLLENVKDNFVNSITSEHHYGLDGPMTTWTLDKNNNVVVDSNEIAMLFLGMRRGGSNYYAFDVSDREYPKLKWVIRGGEGDFKNLGQSWSRMVPTKIKYKGKDRNVLIFGGGYDTSNDVDYTIGAVPKEEDNIGNSIYIVDAEDGTLVYELGHTFNEDASQRFSDMKYAIPSDIRVLDVDGNGFADAMFVGDLGGQVWRLDFDIFHGLNQSTSAPLVIGDQPIAKLGLPHSKIENNRRFFYEPDVALINEKGERYLSIAIGSGWRSHPLNTDVREAFYMIRSNDVFQLPEGYGKPDGNGSYTPITETDLTDVTNDLDNSIGPYGWRLGFNEPGEKVLGDALTVNSQVVFTTYLPESELSLCSAELGSGAAYALRVSDARPSLDLNNDNKTDLDDRSTILAHAGVPPEATALIVEGQVDGETVITPTVLVGPEQPLDGIFSENLTVRGSWVDAGMTEEGAHGASLEEASLEEE